LTEVVYVGNPHRKHLLGDQNVDRR